MRRLPGPGSAACSDPSPGILLPGLIRSASGFGPVTKRIRGWRRGASRARCRRRRVVLTPAGSAARCTAGPRRAGHHRRSRRSRSRTRASLRDAEAAYRNFFASLKGTRKGPKTGAPRLKPRKNKWHSTRFTADARWSLTAAGRLNLPKIAAMPDTDQQIGNDLGLTHFAILSDGTEIGSPRFLRRAPTRRWPTRAASSTTSSPPD